MTGIRGEGEPSGIFVGGDPFSGSCEFTEQADIYGRALERALSDWFERRTTPPNNIVPFRRKPDYNPPDPAA